VRLITLFLSYSLVAAPKRTATGVTTMESFLALLADEEGANMAEYAIVVSLIAVVCVVVVKAVGQTTSSIMFQRIADSM
jgi:Flp pilus assembly pilin Flp